MLEFDEETGQMKNKQVSFEEVVRKTSPVEIPWKPWHADNQLIAAKHADKAALISILETMHSQWDTSKADVKIVLMDGKTSVVAGADMEAGTIFLPPCMPPKNMVYDSSHDHPMAVPVSVALAENTGDAVEAKLDDLVADASHHSDFLLCPEFKAPTLAPTAVAADAGGEPDEPEWIKLANARVQLRTSEPHAHGLSHCGFRWTEYVQHKIHLSPMHLQRPRVGSGRRVDLAPCSPRQNKEKETMSIILPNNSSFLKVSGQTVKTYP